MNSGFQFGMGHSPRRRVTKLKECKKIALHIIYGKKLSYSQACKFYRIEKLVVRRENLCVNFAKKAVKHDKFMNWFLKVGNDPNQKTKYMETVANSKRLENAPIPYLTKLLNKCK